jgi:hypothetical protein
VNEYFQERSARKARQIGYGGYFDSDPKVAQSNLTPEQREALLEELGGRTMQAAEGLFGILDTPASYLRDFVSGRPAGSGTTTGQALDELGLRPSADSLGGWGRPLVEFAAGAILDPLNLVSFGGAGIGGAAVKGLRTAGGINMLDDVARIASRKAISSGNTSEAFAQNALKSWADNFGKGADDLTDADLLARPLVGPRQSRRATTVREVVEAQPDRQRVIEALEAQRAASGKTYRQLADERLTHDIGIGMPFSDHSLIGFNIPGGETIARNLDRAGQMARWSGAGVRANAAFNRDTFGATEEAGQIVGKEVSDALRLGSARAGDTISRTLQDLDPSAFSADVARSMRRVLDGVPEAGDIRLLQSRPDLRRFADRWSRPGGIAEQYLYRRAAAGLKSEPLRDRYGGSYFPRHVDDLSFLDKIAQEGRGRSPKAGRAFSGATGDQMQRLRALNMPGGTETVNRLSLDANVAGPNRLLATDDEAARYIKKEVDEELRRRFPTGLMPDGNKVLPYSIHSAKKVARTLRQLDPEAIQKKLPMFGSSFIKDFERYVTGNERAISLNETLFDLIGSSAKRGSAGSIPGGGHVSMAAALKKLGLNTIDNRALVGPQPLIGSPRQTLSFAGAKKEVIDRLQARFPGITDDLSQVSLDKRMMDRLTRIADFYDYPEVQKGWLKFYDDMTRLWKGSILSWPARFVRDWYSAIFTNLVEVGNPNDLVRGYVGAKRLMQGQFDDLDSLLAMMPKYRKLAKSARRREYLADLAAGGILGGRRSLDTGDAINSIQSGMDVADEYLPGMNPRTTIGMQAMDMLGGRKPLHPQNAAYAELYSATNWKRFWDMGLENPRDIGNPILRWGQKIGDLTDSQNRLSGFNALLLQGIDPLEAAHRMKAAHIDYGSLTALERETFRRFIPFWAYTSRVSKWVAGKIMEKPGGRYTQFGLRAPQTFMESGEEEYVPESIRGSYGFPNPRLLPSRLFGQEKSGVTPWLTDIDLPGIDQMNMLRLAFKPTGMPDLSQTIWNTAKDSAGKNLHPFPKSFLEMVTGENLYSKRPLKEFNPAVSELAEDALGISPHSVYGRAIKTAAPLVDAVPFLPRFFQISNRLMDDEKVPDRRDRFYQLGVNMFSGVKFQNVDDQARRIDAMKKIDEMVEQDPNVRSLTQVYIPEEAEPFVDPRTVQYLALDRQLGRELKRERELRLGIAPSRTKRRNTDPMGYFD